MSHRFMKPCLDCGELSRAARCPTHQAERERQRPKAETLERKARKRAYYNSDYQKRARWIRQTAEQCHICGEGPRPGDPWQADHLEPGNPASPLAPAHRSCNAKRGNKPLPNSRPSSPHTPYTSQPGVG